MFKLFKKVAEVVAIETAPRYTVEQIHAEFDSAQERILSECDKMLAELQIPTETHVERKAAMLKQLGFENAEPVTQYEKFVKGKEAVAKKVELTSNQASYIRELSQRYPFEKFITVDELDRICNKYGLIHAPVKNYIKDIPEKNVVEMASVKPLMKSDKAGKQYIIFDMPQSFLDLIGKKGKVFTEEEVFALGEKYYLKGEYFVEWIDRGITAWAMVVVDKIKGVAFYHDYNYNKISFASKEGLFIAAPKSHFNTDGLSKESKHGFFEATKVEVKDPVVFEYCKNNICRIISKWGTDDDQSYLDPSLQNEKLN